MAQDTVASRTRAAQKKVEKQPLSRQYLIAYNAISFLLWASILGRIYIITGLAGIASVYPSSGAFAQGVQTLALLEIVHSLIGIVRAPIMTTAMQVASRLLLVWGIVGIFGDNLLLGKEEIPFGKVWGALGVASGSQLEYNQMAYLGMLTAWSVTECVRYGYFVFFLSNGGNANAVPGWLGWLRYNTFFVLYPLGISCECWLVYSSLGFARKWDVRYMYALVAILAIYVPGSYILFTHMMAQRKRVMKGKQKQ